MNNNRVFEILVYRLSPELRAKEREKLRVAYTDPNVIFQGWGENYGERFLNNLTEEQQKEVKENWKRFFEYSPEARGWLYNDIIGYLTVFIYPNLVKAEFWFLEGRIRQDMKNRIFRYGGKAFEFWIFNTDTSLNIFEKIKAELLALKSKKPFKGRYIDLEAFENVGACIDWMKLLELVV